MRIRIDLKIFLFLILFYFTKQIEIYSFTMIFCMLHEFGHVLLGLCLGLKIDKINIMPLGFSVSFKIDTNDYNKKIKNANLIELKKILIAVAGPYINLMIIIFSLFVPINNKNDIIIYSNLAILLFNLLPIYPLDGGRIVKSILYILYGNFKSKHYIYIISNISILIISIILFIGFLYTKNIGIIIIEIFLWSIVVKENIKYKKILKYINYSKSLN